MADRSGYISDNPTPGIIPPPPSYKGGNDGNMYDKSPNYGKSNTFLFVAFVVVASVAITGFLLYKIYNKQ